MSTAADIRYEKIKKNHTYENEASRADCDTCQLISWYEGLLDQYSSFQSQVFLASKEGQIFCAAVDGVEVYLVTKDKIK